MVLLNSGHVTIVLSSILVSLFTFLLFLSGYILQQQTVRSLQEALHPPPLPSPTLPTFFSDVGTKADAGSGASEVISVPGTAQKEDQVVFKPIRGSSKQDVLNYVQSVLPDGVAIKQEEVTSDMYGNEQKQTIKPSVSLDVPNEIKAEAPKIGAAIGSTKQETAKVSTDSALKKQHEPSLGYIMLAATPSSICSAILLCSHFSFSESIAKTRIIVYPAFWEDPSIASEGHITALSLLRRAVEDHHITILPINLPASLPLLDLGSSEMELAMLSSLRTASFYALPTVPDTLLYVRSPGLLIDAHPLDSALKSAGTKPARVSKDWTIVPTPTSPSFYPHHSAYATPPSLLLISIKDDQDQPSFYSPSSSSRVSNLVLPALTVSHANHRASDMELEAKAARGSGVGYILFSEEELKHRRGEKDWYDGVFERYERGRKEVCGPGIDTVLESVEWRNAGQDRRDKEKDRGRGW
ncbi:hypothetical protein UCRPC4_g03395 [Phaeomoniella chlamydospora]|uniref:Glycosyltransferase family 8 protein n=1 Tax=Phaeomoniella chlamydospora TaxID=158046 RepID=A0A0G2EHV4_PHACM|nr:hypothetical protein UCRPC4_g03395 [Phaeomoniella chlamydospora]